MWGRMTEPAPGFVLETAAAVAPIIHWTTDRGLTVRSVAGASLSIPFCLGRSVADGAVLHGDVVRAHNCALAGDRACCVVEHNAQWFALSVGPLRASDGQIMGVTGAGLLLEGPLPVGGTLLEVTAPIREWGALPGDYVMVTATGPILLRPVSSLSRPLGGALVPISGDRQTPHPPDAVRLGPLRVVR